MRKAILTVAVPAILFPVVTFASCFSVVDWGNNLVYQSVVPPIDLSLPVSVGMAQRFPGQFLIIADNVRCSEIRESPAARLVEMGSPANAASGAGAAQTRVTPR